MISQNDVQRKLKLKNKQLKEALGDSGLQGISQHLANEYDIPADKIESGPLRVKAATSTDLLLSVIPKELLSTDEKTRLLDIYGKPIYKTRIWSALILADGNITKAFKILKVNNLIPLCMYVANDPECKKIQKWFKTTLIQKAEDAILNGLQDQDGRVRLESAKFILRTLGKNDGWSESPMVNVDMRKLDSKEAKKAIEEIFGLQTIEQLEELKQQQESSCLEAEFTTVQDLSATIGQEDV